LARQQPSDFRDELLAWREPGYVDLDLGIATFGDALPPVERCLGELGVGKHPEPVRGNGIGHQVGHGGRCHPFIDGAVEGAES
jgi:hypothetical protein